MNRLGTAAQLAAAAPVGRDEARRAAEQELSKSIYHENEPTLLERAIERVVTWIQELLSRAIGATPGGGLGLLVVALIVVGLIVVVLWRVGPLRRGVRGSAPVLDLSRPAEPDEHRRRADEHAAAGRWAEAVRERMRAIVRELETRGVLEPRPGRTADEVARDAGVLVPTVAGELRTAAGVFDEIWFGGRPADARADAVMRSADDRIRRARLAVAEQAVPAAGFQVPR
jgi:hypothetical protein